MRAISVLAIASLVGLLTAGSVNAVALAWHPKGVITKSVMNQTAGTALSDANDAGSAVTAKPGDVLKYVIEIRNDGSAGNSNEMHFTKLTDTLPIGVELVSDTAKREINEDLGVIKPGAKVTKEYVVKVTSTKDGDLIENRACFTGNSEVKDNPQKGCDVANVKITIPPKVETPAPAPTPAPTPAPQVPAAHTESMPQTGVSEFFAPIAALASGAIAYIGRLISLKRRSQ